MNLTKQHIYYSMDPVKMQYLEYYKRIDHFSQLDRLLVSESMNYYIILFIPVNWERLPVRWSSSRTWSGTPGRADRPEWAPPHRRRPSWLARPCQWRSTRTVHTIISLIYSDRKTIFIITNEKNKCFNGQRVSILLIEIKMRDTITIQLQLD